MYIIYLFYFRKGFGEFFPQNDAPHAAISAIISFQTPMALLNFARSLSQTLLASSSLWSTPLSLLSELCRWSSVSGSATSMGVRQHGHELLMRSHWWMHSWWKILLLQQFFRPDTTVSSALSSSKQIEQQEKLLLQPTADVLEGSLVLVLAVFSWTWVCTIRERWMCRLSRSFCLSCMRS